MTNEGTIVPVVEVLDGKVLTQSYAILRNWGRKLRYEGKTEEEVCFADLICDILVECRS